MDIIQITKYTYVIFEDGTTLPITEIGQSYQAFAYWSGELEDSVAVQEGLHYATEFVAKQMNVIKESSYAVNAKKYKKEVEELLSSNKITTNSKKTLEAFLASETLPMPGKNEDEKAFSSFKTTNLKTLKTYFTEGNKKEMLIKSIEFNTNNQPLVIKYYSDGEERTAINFTYNSDGLLTKIETGLKIKKVNYNDDKMIFSSSDEETVEVVVYWVENNNLLDKGYELRNDDLYSYLNYYTEEKLENDCVVFYLNDEILKKNCTTKEDVFPCINAYTSYQDGELLQFRKLKIVKKDEKTYANYYSNAETESDADDYKLWGIFIFNDKKELTNYNFVKDGEKRTIKVNYTYYQ